MNEKERYDLVSEYFGWFGLITIMIIFFLGALQAKYQYQTTFVQNFTQTCGIAIKNIYGNGERHSFWLWLSPLMIIGYTYLFISQFIEWFKWKNKEFKRLKEEKASQKKT